MALPKKAADPIFWRNNILWHVPITKPWPYHWGGPSGYFLSLNWWRKTFRTNIWLKGSYQACWHQSSLLLSPISARSHFHCTYRHQYMAGLPTSDMSSVYLLRLPESLRRRKHILSVLLTAGSIEGTKSRLASERKGYILRASYLGTSDHARHAHAWNGKEKKDAMSYSVP